MNNNGIINNSETYTKLIAEFPLTSIRTEQQLKFAQKVIDGLLAKPNLNAGEKMYLDALSDLVANYEDEHYPIAPASDADMLRHLMDLKGMSQADLHRETRIPKSTISQVLAEKRSFSRNMIGKLATYFEVDSSVLASNL